MSKDKAEEKARETYTPDWEFVTGSFDSTFKMLACPKDKYKEVTINLTKHLENLGNGKIKHGLNYSIAKVDLHNGTFGSATKVFDDATKLAEQIAKRWNEHNSLSTENAQLREALREIIKECEEWIIPSSENSNNCENNHHVDIDDLKSLIDKAKQLLTDNTK